MKAIPQEEFQKCLQQWRHHWTKNTVAQEECFEGDPSQWAVSKQVCLKSFRELHSHTTYNSYTKHTLQSFATRMMHQADPFISQTE
jgi:hypothetical protein